MLTRWWRSRWRSWKKEIFIVINKHFIDEQGNNPYQNILYFDEFQPNVCNKMLYISHAAVASQTHWNLKIFIQLHLPNNRNNPYLYGNNASSCSRWLVEIEQPRTLAYKRCFPWSTVYRVCRFWHPFWQGSWYPTGIDQYIVWLQTDCSQIT